MSNGWLVASRIVEKLSGDTQIACLRALHEGGQGQARLSSGDPNGCVTYAMRAHDLLVNIPEAGPILGVVKQDIAAAYGALGRQSDAARFAQEAIELVHGVNGLVYTEAMAYVTLGVNSYLAHDGERGARYFSMARNLIRDRPGTEQGMRLLDENESMLKADQPSTRRKWWKF